MVKLDTESKRLMPQIRPQPLSARARASLSCTVVKPMQGRFMREALLTTYRHGKETFWRVKTPHFMPLLKSTFPPSDAYIARTRRPYASSDCHHNPIDFIPNGTAVIPPLKNVL